MKNYSNREIKWLVEEYEELREIKGTDSDGRVLLLCKLADLQTALERTDRVYREALLLCGMYGLSTRSAGALLQVSADTMNKRYKRGLESLSRYLNNAVQRPRA